MYYVFLFFVKIFKNLYFSGVTTVRGSTDFPWIRKKSVPRSVDDINIRAKVRRSWGKTKKPPWIKSKQKQQSYSSVNQFVCSKTRVSWELFISLVYICLYFIRCSRQLCNVHTSICKSISHSLTKIVGIGRREVEEKKNIRGTETR